MCDRYDIGVHGRTRLTRLVLIAIGMAAIGPLGGCPNDSTAPTLASATSHYDAGQYELARTEGTDVASRGPAADRPQAELISGMAAFQLDRFDDAERHFLAAERSATPSIRGRARVMLANIRLEQGRTDDAAALFESGASDLTGADAEKARRYATLARDGQLGDGQSRAMPVVTAATPPRSPSETASPASASPGRMVAPPGTPARATGSAVASTPKPPAPPAPPPPRAPASDASTRAPVPAASATSDSAFTVRAGAYTTKAAATRRVKALAADVRRAKAPEPHIAPVTTKDGDTLYAVRIGSFRSRADAEAVLKRLARKDLAVGAL